MPFLWKSLTNWGNFTSTIEGYADLLTPTAQFAHLTYKSLWGEYEISLCTSVNPITQDKNEFVYALYLNANTNRRFLPRILERKALQEYIQRHIIDEDHQIFGGSEFALTDDMRLTPEDDTLLAMRAMFSKYLAAKSHLYPKDSLIHELSHMHEFDVSQAQILEVHRHRKKANKSGEMAEKQYETT